MLPKLVLPIFLTGFLDQNRVADMIKESVKMHSFEHPHVLNIIGVCVDAGPSPYIVMPFMANGSLLTYIRKEKNLVVPTDSIDDDLASVFRYYLHVHACGVKYLFLSDSQQVNRRLTWLLFRKIPALFYFYFVTKLTAPKWKKNGDLKGEQPNLSCS